MGTVVEEESFYHPHPVHRRVLFFSSASNWHKNFAAGQITEDKGIRGIFCIADLSQEPKEGGGGCALSECTIMSGNRSAS